MTGKLKTATGQVSGPGPPARGRPSAGVALTEAQRSLFLGGIRANSGSVQGVATGDLEEQTRPEYGAYFMCARSHQPSAASKLPRQLSRKAVRPAHDTPLLEHTLGALCPIQVCSGVGQAWLW